ncbi:MAG TPA: hypothetical protein VFZ99_05385 [Terriglobales bacterium]
MGPETQITQSAPHANHDRRHEYRALTHDSLTVFAAGPDGEAEFQAILVDSSRSGLCIRHWRKGLPVGHYLRICSTSSGEIRAQVMWNWSVGPVVMSGLKIVNSSPSLHCDVSGSAGSKSIRKSLILGAAATLLVLITWFAARW